MVSESVLVALAAFGGSAITGVISIANTHLQQKGTDRRKEAELHLKNRIEELSETYQKMVGLRYELSPYAFNSVGEVMERTGDFAYINDDVLASAQIYNIEQEEVDRMSAELEELSNHVNRLSPYIEPEEVEILGRAVMALEAAHDRLETRRAIDELEQEREVNLSVDERQELMNETLAFDIDSEEFVDRVLIAERVLKNRLNEPIEKLDTPLFKF
jgi:hypothetical protein